MSTKVRSSRRRPVTTGLAGLALIALAVVVFGGSRTHPATSSRPPAVAAPPASCDLSATPATFASQVLAAGPGQTICLESGTYGRWTGTDKRITVRPAKGSTATMLVNFGTYAAGFTLDGMSGMGGMITAGAQNITIENSRFAYQLRIDGAVTNIVVNHNDFMYPVRSTLTGPNSKIFLDATGGAPGSAATIENNDIENGDLDGVHFGGGSGVLIVGNTFRNICDRGVNHTDNIQFESGTRIRVAGNYIYAAQSCPTTGITSYDGGTDGVIIEDNVIDVPRDWGIELYSDKNSIVRHNTIVWHPGNYSEFGTSTGQIAMDRKSQDPPGAGTQVYDNIATGVGFGNGSTGSQYDNVSGENAVYAGPTNSWAGFKLSPDSPVGLHAASDGLDDGARISR